MLTSESGAEANGVVDTSFDLDSKRIVTIDRSGTTRLWDATDGKMVAELVGRGNNAAAFSSDGTNVVVVSARPLPRARVWRTRDASPVAEFDIRRPRATMVYSFSLSSDGEFLFLFTEDWGVPQARVWNAFDGSVLSELETSWDYVSVASFSANGRRLIVGFENGTARVFKITDGSLLAELRGHKERIVSASFSPDGERVVTAADGDAVARIWGPFTAARLETALSDATSLCLNPDKRQNYLGESLDEARRRHELCEASQGRSFR
jgi:WD40 repeat protein